MMVLLKTSSLFVAAALYRKLLKVHWNYNTAAWNLDVKKTLALCPFSWFFFGSSIWLKMWLELFKLHFKLRRYFPCWFFDLSAVVSQFFMFLNFGFSMEEIQWIFSQILTVLESKICELYPSNFLHWKLIWKFSCSKFPPEVFRWL